MKFLVASLPANLYHGFNTACIGEERWGCNIAKALLRAGHEVCTFPNHGIWHDSAPPHPNYFPEAKPESDMIYIGYEHSGIDINFFNRLFLCRFDSFGKQVHFPAKVTIVHPYPAGSRFDALRNEIEGTQCAFLPFPVYNQGDYGTNNIFTLPQANEKKIFWSAKSGFNQHSQSTQLTKSLVQLIADKSTKAEPIYLTMVASAHSQNTEQALNAIYNHRYYKILTEHNVQVELLPDITPYNTIIDECANADLIINPGNFHQTYGGASIEAALCYRATVQYKNHSPFVEIENQIYTVNDSKEYEKFVSFTNIIWQTGVSNQDTIDKTLTNVAAIMHDYACSTYSESRFLSELSKLL